MATILYPYGTSLEVQPANGRDFMLDELQKIVGGHIEIVSTKDNRILVLNDEAKLLGLPRNEQATALAALLTPEDRAELKAIMGDDIIIVGDIDEPDYIAGVALVCEDHEVQ